MKKSEVYINSKKVSCSGDVDNGAGHPLVYLNMGNNLEIECPYCSKIFKFAQEEER
jgi:uncharacterized Zn-finger protein